MREKLLLLIKNKWVRLCAFGAAGLFLLLFIGVFGLFMAVRVGLFGKLPSEADLAAIKNPQAAEVYSADGILLGKYFIEDRVNVAYDQIPKTAINALIATEDARFRQHKGVDTRSTLRVIFKNILMGDRGAGGGSTINQQLIKNLYKREDFGILSIPVFKFKEIIVGRRLEKVYDKNDILAHYLNTVSFGERVFGIESASQRFFSKSCKNLELHESALLIGMLKANTKYNPRRNPKDATIRRNTVINQMEKYGYISEKIAEKFKAKDLDLQYNRQDHNTGLAPHFRAHLKKELKEWCANHTKADGKPYNLFTDGLKIYTTLNARMQEMAEEAAHTHLLQLQKDLDIHWGKENPWGNQDNLVLQGIKQSDRYKRLKARGVSEKAIAVLFDKKVETTVFTHEGEKQLTMSPRDSVEHHLRMMNSGFLVMDHDNGQILSWVGSANHKYFPYDHTKSQRQVGSTFKPIVYATAIEQGANPCDFYPNELRTYLDHQNWTPRNSDGEYGGEYSMIGGLAGSVNTISVQVLLEAGIPNIIAKARELGIHNDIPEVASIALGTPDLSLQEMITAYASFGNGGYKVEPSYLLKIADNKGKTLERFRPYTGDPIQVLEAETAAYMVKMLEAVVDSGTGKRLRHRYGITGDIGGKTGTTQNHGDGWFIGVTPRLVAGVWTGGATPQVRFRSIGLGQGANMALPVLGEFLQRLYEDPKYKSWAYEEFQFGDDEYWASTDCDFFREFPPMLESSEPDLMEVPSGDPRIPPTAREGSKSKRVDKRTNTSKRKDGTDDPRRKKKKKKGFFGKIKDIFSGDN